MGPSKRAKSNHQAPAMRPFSTQAYVADPWLPEGDMVLPGRPFLREQFSGSNGGSSNRWKPLMSTQTLPRADRYTDGASCLLDAFNGAVGSLVLTRQRLRDNGWDGEAALQYVSVPVVRTMQQHGFQLRLVHTGPKKRRYESPPSIEQIMGQSCGSYIAEFHWRVDHQNANYHAIAINCTTRKLTCNAVGVVPMQLDKVNESETTHTAIKDRFHIYRMLAVWQVLRDESRHSP